MKIFIERSDYTPIYDVEDSNEGPNKWMTFTNKVWEEISDRRRAAAHIIQTRNESIESIINRAWAMLPNKNYEKIYITIGKSWVSFLLIPEEGWIEPELLFMESSRPEGLIESLAIRKILNE